MKRSKQPDPLNETPEKRQPSLEELLNRAEQSNADFADIRAAGKAIADLAKALEQVAQEEDATSSASENKPSFR